MEDAWVGLDSHLVLSPTQDGPVIAASIQTVNQLKYFFKIFVTVSNKIFIIE